MCHLNILIKKSTEEPMDNIKYMSMLSVLTTNSFVDNHNGEGFFFSSSGKLIRSLNKIELLCHIPEIKASNIIIGHERISTSGFNAEMTQPFHNGDFIFVHNGIMKSFESQDTTKSDSFNFFTEFQKEFAEQKGEREERLVNAIKKLCDKEYIGYYSIGIYDLVAKRLYYFKNAMANVNFYTNEEKDFVYISTPKIVEYLAVYYNKVQELNIEDYKIYRIDCDEIKVTEIGEIEQYVSSYKSVACDYDEWYGDYKPYTSKNKLKKQEKKDRKEAVKQFKESYGITKEDGFCDYCSKRSKYLSPFIGIHLCDECIIERAMEERIPDGTDFI